MHAHVDATYIYIYIYTPVFRHGNMYSLMFTQGLQGIGASSRLGATATGAIRVYVCVYIYIYIYIHMKREPCGAQTFGIFYVETCVSPRRDAPFQQLCCCIVGKHHFSKQALRLSHIHVFKFMRCFAKAKQHFQHAHVNQKGSMGNQKP